MKFTGALNGVAEGVLIRVELTAGSKYLGISGYDKWRQAIRIKLTERARGGKANEQLIKYLADVFKKPTPAVRLISGHASSRKVILLSDTIVDEVELVIEQAMNQ
jgi:uncharacterized protein (TIGR00251 family)